MLPKKYHAIIFIGILVMLLLLGLHLLGIGYSGSQAAAKSAALARNSSQPSSSASSALNAALSQNQVYRHPISYDKLTGATNNQISDVLGAKQPAADYPIDHYQQQQQQQQAQQRQQQSQFAANPLAAQDDFFANIHRGQAPAGFPPPPLGHHPALSHRLQMGPPPLVHQMAMTTQPPLSMPLPPPPPPTPPSSSSQRSDQLLQPAPANVGGSSDSLPSASSLTGASGARPPSNNTQQQQQQQQQQQPAHYTPPIFAYNNFDQQQQQQQQQALGHPAGQFSEPGAFGFSVPSQRLSLNQPLGLAQEMPPDEYQARQQQARLRHLSQQQLQAANEVSQPQLSNQQQQSPNLLADPQQQQRHKQQMLDRQLLFSNNQPSVSPFDSNLLSLNQTHQRGFAAPDPAASALYRPGGAARQPPYAHSGLSGSQMGAAARIASPASLGLNNNNLGARLEEQSGGNQLNRLHHQLQMPERQLVKSLNPAPLPASAQQQGQPQQQHQLALSTNSPNSSSTSQIPVCAAKQRVPNSNGLEFANSSAQPIVLFCNEDSEYPTKDIMRALEAYATERSIEQLLPQLLIHMDQRAISAGLNPLLPDDGASPIEGGLNQQRLNQQPMSSNNYESMCRSASYLTQPRRARNLVGQWKVVVNLPGHKYRGIAVSQMVRVEECLRPNIECNTSSSSSSSTPASSLSRSTVSGPPSASLLPKSRCLQHYESQRLVAWSHQQGLHLDIFRVPIACSCHIRR